MKKIPIKKRRHIIIGYALVDDEDFEKVSTYDWRLNTKGYVACSIRIGTSTKYRTLYLHRLIMNCPKGLEVDHKNGNLFDCRKSQLRNITHAQNLMNRGKNRNNTGDYKGVSWNKRFKRWDVFLTIGWKRIWGGSFPTDKQAAIRYNELSRKHHGKFGRLNVIHK